MKKVIAIHPDDYTDPGSGKCDASSPRWAKLLRDARHEVRWVDVFADNILDQLAGCDGFMWRHIHTPRHRAVARRLLPVLEDHLGLCVYPDRPTAWHYDDKIAQLYLLRALEVPTPRTWVFWDYDEAAKFCRGASYPLVLKLWAGAGSKNVKLLHDADDAQRRLVQLFEPGVRDLASLPSFSIEGMRRRFRDSVRYLAAGEWPNPGSTFELHKNYALLQRFLPGNGFDTRVTVVGNRAFAYRRFNRPDDFRASGSGDFDPNPDPIDLDMVRLAFDAARKIGAQSVAIDGLYDEGNPVVAEVSYTYVSWMVHDCPGHWSLENEELVWHDGAMWPEQAQLADFLARIGQQVRQWRAA